MFKNRFMPQVFHNTSGGGGMSGNPLELQIGVGIDVATETKKLQKQIDTIKGIQAQIDASLTENTLTRIEKQLNGLSTKGLKINASLNVAETKRIINEQLKNMKLDNLEIAARIKTDSSTKNPNTTTTSGNTKREKVSAIDYTADEKGLQKLKDKYEKEGFRVKVHYDELNGMIKKVEAIGKEAQNIGKNLVFKPSIDESGLKGLNLSDVVKDNKNFQNLNENLNLAGKKLEELKTSGKVAKEALSGLEKHFNNLKGKSLDGSLNNAHVEKFTARLKDMKNELTSVPSFINKVIQEENKLKQYLHQGILTTNQYSAAQEKLNKIRAGGSSRDLSAFSNQTSQEIASIKRVNQLSAEISKVTTKETEMLAALERIQRQHPKTFNPQEAQRLKQTIDQLIGQYKQLDSTGKSSLKFTNLGDAQKLMQDLRQVNAEIKRMGANAAEAGRNSMTLWDSFKVAMSKFPVWMAASTVFYGITKGAQDLTQTIIEVDTQMTNLKKVMSADTDFGQVFDNATSSARNFGQTLTDVLSSYNEFAKQGFKGNELEGLSNTALITANVGELSAQDASQFITSSLIQWDKKVEDSMSIIDNFNELSNNYAVSTQQLAEANAKAASVAKGMGLSFEQFNSAVGVIAAATRQSGSEVGNSLKAILPRLTQKTGQDALASIGVGLTDGQGNMRDVIEIYKEVAVKVKELNEIEKAQVIMGLGGTYHRTRLTALLDDLGKADSMYDQMYQSSLNSAGSAERENDTYMQSLQARINTMKAEAQVLAVSIGEAFLSSGMTEFFTAIADGIQTITSLVEKVGALPALFVAINTVLFLCSSSFRNLTATIGAYALAALRGQASTSALTGKMKGLQATAVATGFTLKSLAASTGIGLAFVGVGFAIEKLMEKQAKLRQASEDLENQNKQLKSSYEENADSVNGIVSQLASYEQAMNAGELDLNGEQEYVRLKNELATLLPNLSLGTDAYGNAILGNSTIIQGQLDLIQSQIDKEKELQAIKDAADARKQIDDNKDNIKDLSLDQIANKSKLNYAVNKNRNVNDEHNKIDIISMNDTEKIIANAQKRLEQMKNAANSYAEKGQMSMADKATKDAQNLEKVLGKYVSHASQIEQANTLLNNNYAKTAVASIIASKTMENQSKNFVNTFISAVNSTEQEGNKLESFYSSLDVSINTDKFKNAFSELDSVINDFTSAKKKFEVGEISTKEFEESRKVLESEISKVRNMLVKLAEEKGIDTSSFLVSFDASVSGLLGFEKAVDKTGKTTEEVKSSIAGLSDGIEGVGESAASATEEFANVAEAMAGMTSNTVSSIENAIATFNIMSGTVQEGTVQYAYLQEQMSFLIAQFPYLESALKGTTEQQAKAIGMIESETAARKVLSEAYALEAEGKISMEGRKTAKQLTKTDNRIALINQEIEALNSLIAGYERAQQAALDTVAKGDQDSSTIYDAYGAAELSAQLHGEEIKKAKKQFKAKEAKLATLTATQETQTGALTQHVEASKEAAKATDTKTGSTKKATEATKKDTEETKKNTVENLAQKESLLALNTVLDKYKNSISEIDLSLKKLNNARSKFAQGSKEYRKYLKQEIELNKEKIEVLNQQYRTQKQVAGLEASMEDPYKYETASSSSSSGSGSYSSSSGSNYSGNYASIINAAAKKHGVDPALIAAIIKQESNFNPNARSHVGATGLMQLMPATARSLGVRNSNDPTQNVNGGAKYIAQMLKQFGGDLEKALRAYNAGPGNVLNGKAYKFKETNDYVRKVTANYNNYKKSGVSDSSTKALNANTKAIENNTNVASKTVKTQKRKLSGWAGSFVSNKYGAPRGRESLTNGKHIGVDIQHQGIYGKTLESNVAGIVKFAGRKSGNVGAVEGQKVVIVDASGKEHSYKHLKDINVKAGDQVAVGSKIGSVGGKYKSEGITIKSKLGHLHYEVRDKNGNWIDPTSFANAAMGKVTTGGVENLSGGSYLSDIDASATGVVDKNSYLSPKEQALDLQNQIREYIAEMVDSYLAFFEQKIDVRNDRNALREVNQSKYTETSTKYRKYNTNILKDEKKNYKDYKAEASLLKGIIQSGKVDGYDLTEAQLEEFRDKLRDLNVSVAETAMKIKELRFDNIISKLDAFAERIEKSSQRQGLAEAKQSKVATSSQRYRELQNTAIKESKIQYKNAQKEKREVDKQIKAEKKRKPLTAKQKKTANKNLNKYEKIESKSLKKINDLKEKLADKKNKLTKKEIKATEKSLKEEREKRTLAKKEIKELKKKISTNKTLTPAQLAELEAKSVEYAITIEELRVQISDEAMEKVNSYRENYSYKSSIRQYATDRDSLKRNQADSSSSRYRSLTTENIKNLKTQTTLKRQELNMITQQLKNANLTAAAQRELLIIQRELKISLLDLNEAIQEERMLRVNSKIEEFDNSFDGFDYLNQMSEIYQSTLTEGSSGYKSEKDRQYDYTIKKLEILQDKADYLYSELGNTELSFEQREDLLKQWRDVRLLMANTVTEQMNANKQVADDFVELMKKAYEKKREVALKAIDDERTAYSKLINDMIKAIDKSEQELSHQEERADKKDEIANKKKKIDQLSLDDSQLAKAEKKKLQEELAELEKDYAKWERQYNNEQKKEALQEQLEEKNEQLDSEQKATERFYENILEDERRWKKMSADILKGHVDEYIAEFEKMGIFVNGNLATIGESIGITLSDKFQEAIEKMRNLQSETEKYQQLWQQMLDQDMLTNAGEVTGGESPTPDISDSVGNMKYVATKDFELNSNKDGSGTSGGKIEAGKVLTVSKIDGDKAYVKLQDGREGWTDFANMSTSYSDSDRYQRTKKEAKLYNSNNETDGYSTKITADEKLEILEGDKNGWTKVSYNGQTGYIKSANLNATSGSTVDTNITTNGNKYDTNKETIKDYSLKYAQKTASIYKTASDSASVLEKVTSGKQLKVSNTETKNGFTKVSVGNITGWMKTKLIGINKPTGNNTSSTKRKVTEDTKLYKDEKKEASYGTIYKNNTANGMNTVEIIGKALSNGLQKVNFNGKTGYVDASKLAKFDTGGLTPSNIPKSGALAVLHKKELVLNENQTQHMLDIVKMLPKLSVSNPIQGIKLPEIQYGQDSGSSIEIPNLIHIENFNGTQKESNSLAKTLVNEVSKLGANRFKRNK